MATEYWKSMVEAAKEYPIDKLIEEQGLTVIPKSQSVKTTVEHDSICIFMKDNTYWRYSTKNGGSCIDFLINEAGMDYKDAVKHLAAKMGLWKYKPNEMPQNTPAERLQQRPQETPVAFVLPKKAENNKRVYAYLASRGLCGDIIHDFMRKGLLYQSAGSNNCVFVGRDSNGNAKAGYMRGTYTLGDKPFKGNVPGSDKSYGICYEGAENSNTVYCFEAPIDMMSFMQMTGEKYRQAHKLALCGVDDTALQRFLTEHKNLGQIVLCLDNDKAGIEATVKMEHEYGKLYTVNILTPPQGKDWNDSLVAQRAKERGTTSFSDLYEKRSSEITERARVRSEQKYAPER